jgi:hypothetical protein
MLHRLIPLLLLSALAGCESLPRTPFTAEEQAKAEIPGLPGARFWADAPDVAREASRLSRQQERNLTYLALSGGGGDGAYGAGILNGWTKAGGRPQFTIVSGVSTGALIAPFAFLGPAYDDTLRELYTGGLGATLVDSPNPIGALFGAGVFDNNRLRDLVRRFVTPDMVAQVAAEHAKGRRLLIVTTNLDAQRPVIWNMGEIAAAGTDESLRLFQDVMTASASVPGVFTPELITARANGRYFQEMHVDGGVTSNVFILPQDFLVRDPRVLQKGSRARFFVILNGKIEPSFSVVDNRTAEIAGRAVTTMTQVQTVATLRATSAFARRNGIGFNLTYIGKEVPDGGSLGFDTSYMRKIYDYGYQKALSREAWRSDLPRPGDADFEARTMTVQAER